MAYVVAFAPDLFFSSKIKATLEQAGHQVTILRSIDELGERVTQADLVIADLASGGSRADLSGGALPARQTSEPHTDQPVQSELERSKERSEGSSGFSAAAVIEALGSDRSGTQLPILGFYAHVDVKVRQDALARGFDLVVPRSRMAREMPELVSTLLAGDTV